MLLNYILVFCWWLAGFLGMACLWNQGGYHNISFLVLFNAQLRQHSSCIPYSRSFWPINRPVCLRLFSSTMEHISFRSTGSCGLEAQCNNASLQCCQQLQAKCWASMPVTGMGVQLMELLWCLLSLYFAIESQALIAKVDVHSVVATASVLVPTHILGCFCFVQVVMCCAVIIEHWH